MNEEVWQAVLDQSSRGVDKEDEQEGLEAMEDDETEEEDEEELEEEMEDEWGEREFVSDLSGDESEEDEWGNMEEAGGDGEESTDSDDDEVDRAKRKTPATRPSKGRPAKKAKREFCCFSSLSLARNADDDVEGGPRVEIEYETEMVGPLRQKGIA